MQRKIKIWFSVPMVVGLFAFICLSLIQVKIIKPSYAKRTKIEKRQPASKGSKKFSVKEFASIIGLKPDSKDIYKMAKGNPSECLQGEIRLLKDKENGSLSIMVGQRVLAYNIFKTVNKDNYSERNCKIKVYTKWDKAAKKVFYTETNKCKDEKPIQVKKVIAFSGLKTKSQLKYQIKIIEGDKEKKTILCELSL